MKRSDPQFKQFCQHLFGDRSIERLNSSAEKILLSIWETKNKNDEAFQLMLESFEVNRKTIDYLRSYISHEKLMSLITLGGFATNTLPEVVERSFVYKRDTEYIMFKGSAGRTEYRFAFKRYIGRLEWVKPTEKNVSPLANEQFVKAFIVSEALQTI